jgi:alkylation response protein AidB-like acyl-CoA dehydrogenase
MTGSDQDCTALIDAVRRFAQHRVADRVRDYDKAEQLPRDLIDEMGALGFMGGTIPPRWGGAGLDHVSYSRIIQEISRVDHCLGVLMSMPSALTGAGLLAYGSDAQRERWLRPLAAGEIFAGAGVTEPQSGTDVAGMQTTYRREGDTFVINGAKTWITNLDIASFFVTFASRDTSQRHKGVSAFVIPKDTPGLSVHPFKNKLGFRPLTTGELVLDEVRVPADALIGTEGDGFNVAMVAVERGRLAVASRAVGAAQLCLDAAIQYARQRVVRGQPIGDYQQIQKKISDMATSIQAARLLVEDCARTLDAGSRGRVETSMAKMFASDVFQSVATEAVQIFGAYGVSDEFPVARMYRDSKVFQIVEGTNEIHRVVIARELLGTGRST